MDKFEARKIVDRFLRNDNPSPNDQFFFIEACSFLIETENDADAMLELGGYYYENEKYDLAEKYYLLAHENGNVWAADGLGFIYYYGRTGARDYKKAFYFFSIAKEKGNLEAAMKIADMYHNGFGVEKDDKKYKEILLDIFKRIENTDQLFDPYPEVAHRLADIYINEGHGEDAIEMLLKGKAIIGERIRYVPFWGNFIVCRRTVNLLYKLIPFNENEFDFFDLFYILAKPHTVKLTYNGKQYLIKSFFDEGEMRVECEGRFYKSIENFLSNAMIEGKHTYIINYDDYFVLELVE